MRVIRRGMEEIAVIDPRKKYGESGQYVSYDCTKDPKLNIVAILAAARAERMEIRYYYRKMTSMAGESVPVKVIITEIPPGHVQPFHTHLLIHEVTHVDEGELIAIESADLTEEDWALIVTQGEVLNPGDTVLEEPGVRHTVMNRDPERYCLITTVQADRTISPEQFKSDWIREEPQTQGAGEVRVVRAPATA
ncbi:cupin domain-containing protein [Candidatus Parcubacteria bacterium]|nr:cupin domain-containing protein [Candidatus Parcubacteria bacterium]